MKNKVIEDLQRKCLFTNDVETTARAYLYWHMKQVFNGPETKEEYLQSLNEAVLEELDEALSVYQAKLDKGDNIKYEMTMINRQIADFEEQLKTPKFNKEEKIQFYGISAAGVIITSLVLNSVLPGSNLIPIAIYLSAFTFVTNKIPNKIFPSLKNMMMREKIKDIESKLVRLRTSLNFSQSLYDINSVNYDYDIQKINIADVISDEITRMMNKESQEPEKLIKIDEFQKMKQLKRTFDKY